MGEKHIPEKLHPAPEADAASKDHVSDPKHSDDTGHDWSDEGGATEEGSAAPSDAGASDRT
ncbi:hypothetical protein [Glutamicibacter protophormiae]|uniref:hypothetical protein n=1 Tax=Glutamicibacter protophormiae TaxID=37930 RepID=UPI003A8FF9F1